jgi:Fe2+ or Zn2+ uptake regulation protein
MLQMESACDRLRAAGLRLTPQRRAVIDALLDNHTHPTADEVAALVASTTPGVSLSTVYKVLHELSGLGLVREIEVPGAVRFDPEPEDHVHVLCADCGVVVDAPLPPEALEAITRALKSTVRTVDRVDVVVHGACRACV